MFQISGIIQLLYKHGIPNSTKFVLTSESITVLIRKANENAEGLEFPTNQTLK